ncbi:hypothetical protein [Ottowia sp. VDI28]|uniref:hypothetical protein n=1 Tax=Ottowia sp. VDI28 TaxID=3133968 RepID=UPI003C2EED8B
MTKPSPILITKRASLANMPEAQRATVRHVLLDAVGGLDSVHNTRWRRFVNRLLRAEPGEVFELMTLTDRSGKFHRRHMALEQRLFDHQERFATLGALRDWLKTGAGWVEWKPGARGSIVPVPRSTAYEACSDDEMREVHEAMLAFLHQPATQRKLWPHLSSHARAAMLESVLASPEQGEQQ